MVEGKKRSRTLRRVKIVTPGHRSVIHYENRDHKQPRCIETGEVLHGMPRGSRSDHMKLSKSQKRPARKFGGVLSSRAARRRIIDSARSIKL
jgi:large subunit ribosomal protein L34e